MANFKGHLTGGLIVASTNLIVFTYLNNIIDGLITFATALIFSLYPDQDIASKSQRYLTGIGIISILYLLLFTGEIPDVNFLPIIIILSLIIMPLLYKHRGFNHSISNIFMLSIMWLGLLSNFITIDYNSYIYIIALVSGYSIHLILDKHWSLM